MSICVAYLWLLAASQFVLQRSVRDGDKRRKDKKSEMSPLWNLPLRGWIPYWGPQALSSSQPILCAHIWVCVCVCVSGGKSMVLVLLSVSSVSLVSYHQPPPAPATQHVLSVSPRGQSTNPTALRLGKPSWKTRLQVCKMGRMLSVKAQPQCPNLRPGAKHAHQTRD